MINSVNRNFDPANDAVNRSEAIHLVFYTVSASL
jgi:hypothetical protein